MGDEVQKPQAGQGGATKGHPLTAWPGLGSEGPSQQRQHPAGRGSHALSLPLAGIDGHCPQYQMSLGPATPRLPLCPSPSQTLPPPPFPWGEGWTRVQVLGQGSKVAGSKATEGGSLWLIDTVDNFLVH